MLLPAGAPTYYATELGVPLESVGQWLVWPTLVGLVAKIAVNAVESLWLARYTALAELTLSLACASSFLPTVSLKP